MFLDVGVFWSGKVPDSNSIPRTQNSIRLPVMRLPDPPTAMAAPSRPRLG